MKKLFSYYIDEISQASFSSKKLLSERRAGLLMPKVSSVFMQDAKLRCVFKCSCVAYSAKLSLKRSWFIFKKYITGFFLTWNARRIPEYCLPHLDMFKSWYLLYKNHEQAQNNSQLILPWNRDRNFDILLVNVGNFVEVFWCFWKFLV